MKIKYYGTAAAEGVPAPFCKCKVCEYSRKHGGKNLRTRSSALINDELLIDIGPDFVYHASFMGLPASSIEHLIITHAHHDHLYTHNLAMRADGFTNYSEADGYIPKINIYGSMPAIDLIFDDLRKMGVHTRERWNLFEIAPFETKKIGDFQVTPYKANHAFNLYPYIYEIFDGEKRLLYGHDTGIFLEETWDYLEQNKPHFDLISLDCTYGLKLSDGDHHLGLGNCAEIKEKLIQMGCADDKTVFIVNHFSHNGSSYDELLPIAKKKGFITSYDGLEIEF